MKVTFDRSPGVVGSENPESGGKKPKTGCDRLDRTRFELGNTLGNSTPSRIRTCDLLIRSQLLYPAELSGLTSISKFPFHVTNFCALLIRSQLLYPAELSGKRKNAWRRFDCWPFGSWLESAPAFFKG